jgi:pimeloyl-ACP methyl ester carboxylesterase
MGSGPPVVFLHPLLTSANHWRKVAPLVAAGGFECILPTLPLGAHRRAMPPSADLTPPGLVALVVDLIRRLGLGPVTLVGNDTGGALSQMIAAQHPEVVERLVLTNCDAFEQFPPPLFRYLTWGARVPGFALSVGQSLRVKALRHTPITFGWLAKNGIPDDVIDEYAAPFLRDRGVRRDVVKVLRGFDKRHTLLAAEGLRSFTKPALLAWAPEDKVFKTALAQRLLGVLPNAQLSLIDGSYAFTPEDQPQVLAQMIIDFCRQ